MTNRSAASMNEDLAFALGGSAVPSVLGKMSSSKYSPIKKNLSPQSQIQSPLKMQEFNPQQSQIVKDFDEHLR